MAEKFRVTVKEKILLHLLGYTRHKDEYEVPPQVTQDGMAKIVGVRRSHIASALKDLKEQAFVEEVKSRIEGQERRKNAYFLTHEGQAECLSLKENILHKKVTFKPQEGPITEMEIIEINKHIPEKLPLVEILGHISVQGVFQLIPEEKVPGLVVESSVVCPFCGQNNINPGLTEINMAGGFTALSAACTFCGNGFLAEDITPPEEKEKKIYRALYIPPEIKPQVEKPPSRLPGGDAFLVSFGLFFMLASFSLLLLSGFGFVPNQLCFIVPFGILISLVMLYEGLRNVRQLNEMTRRMLIVTGAVFAAFIAFIAGAIMGADYNGEEVGTMALVVFPAFAVFIFGKPLARDLRSELSLSLGVFLILFGSFLTAFYELFSWSAATSPFWVIVGAVMIYTSYEIEKLERTYLIRALCAGTGAFCAVFCAVILVAGYDSLGTFRIVGISLWLLVGILLVYTRFMDKERAESVFFAVKNALIAGLGVLFVLAGVVLALNDKLMVSVVEFFIGLPIIWYGLQDAREFSKFELGVVLFILFSEVVAALSFILA
jgi:DNA-binding PadR family transcriptional regulator